MNARRPPASALQDEFAAALLEHVGGDAQAAGKVARQVVDRLVEQWGARTLYVPAQRSLRRASIAEEFNGRNVEDLAARHGVSRSSVYRAVARKKTERRQK